MCESVNRESPTFAEMFVTPGGGGRLGGQIPLPYHFALRGGNLVVRTAAFALDHNIPHSNDRDKVLLIIFGVLDSSVGADVVPQNLPAVATDVGAIPFRSATDEARSGMACGPDVSGVPSRARNHPHRSLCHRGQSRPANRLPQWKHAFGTHSTENLRRRLALWPWRELSPGLAGWTGRTSADRVDRFAVEARQPDSAQRV